MKKQFYIVILTCLLALLFLLPVSAASPTTWNISNVEGPGNYSSLLEICPPGEGDIIRIWGVEGHIYEGGITIDKPDVRIVRWEGSPARPLLSNTSHSAPALTITADNVTLQDLNISGNTYAGDGAGIHVNGTYSKHLLGFTVTGCVFTDNSMPGWHSGGAMYLEYVDNSRITNTTFVNNMASGEGGGAYYSWSNNATLMDTTFVNNMASGDGGGIVFLNSNNAILKDTTFENNSITFGNGGGVEFLDSNDATLTGTTFANNTAGSRGGGACFKTSNNATLMGMIFKNNKATEGGGVCFFFDSNNTALKGTTFENNTAILNGGGAFFESSYNVSLMGTTFENNTANTNGGGVYLTHSNNAVIKNCLFNNENNIYALYSNAVSLNETTPAPGVNVAGGPYFGGNVWLHDPVQNISKWGNDSDFDGICDKPLTIKNYDSEGSVIGNFGIDSYPLVSGGGTVEVTSTPSDAFVYIDGANTTRTAGKSFYFPAGVHNLSVYKEGYLPGEVDLNIIPGRNHSVTVPLIYITPRIWNVSTVEGPHNITSLFNITALGEGDVIRIWGEEGHTYEGGITIDKPDVRIVRWEGAPARPLITNSSGTASALTITADNVTLQGLNISGNSYSTSGNGAGVHINGTYSKHLLGFTVNECNFTGNSMTYWLNSGGAMFLEYVNNIRITNTTFENNKVKYGYGGGAYFAYSNNVTLKSTTFENSYTSWYGGGVFFKFSNNATINGSTFGYNAAGFEGGGVYFENSNDAILDGLTFANNTAYDDGGGVYFTSSNNASLDGLTFANNKAYDDGGGVYFTSSNNASLDGLTFANNMAYNNGSGVYFENSNDALIKNCLFNNEKNLYADGSSAVLNGMYRLETNIAGGPYLGGNLWLKPDGTGFSQTRADYNLDGICDQKLEISGFGIDYFPLHSGGPSANFTAAPENPMVGIPAAFNDSSVSRSPIISWT
ncbi:MAG: NosD domain-containing protein [Methanosarcinaceae archaeon]|nr:NosD domain-containing protein [Methanosarcinaceae archaeon]